MSEEIVKGIAVRIKDIRDTVKKSLDNLEKDLSTYSSLLNLRGKKLLPYCDEGEPEYLTFWYGEDVSRVRPEYVREKLTGTKDEMLGYVNAILAKAEKVHEANLEIIKHNTGVVKTISDFLISLGFSTQRRVEEKIGRGKTSSRYVDAYWVEELKKQFPLEDRIFQEAVIWHKNARNNIIAYWSIQEKKEEEVKQKAEHSRLFNAAVEFLTKHGKVMGKDYQADTATMYAKEVAEDALIDEYVRNGEFIAFSGDGGCEDCRGWKPGEHRCDCGNRRVYFARESATFENPVVYPVAD